MTSASYTFVNYTGKTLGFYDPKIPDGNNLVAHMLCTDNANVYHATANGPTTLADILGAADPADLINVSSDGDSGIEDGYAISTPLPSFDLPYKAGEEYVFYLGIYPFQCNNDKINMIGKWTEDDASNVGFYGCHRMGTIPAYYYEKKNLDSSVKVPAPTDKNPYRIIFPTKKVTDGVKSDWSVCPANIDDNDDESSSGFNWMYVLLILFVLVIIIAIIAAVYFVIKKKKKGNSAY